MQGSVNIQLNIFLYFNNLLFCLFSLSLSLSLSLYIYIYIPTYIYVQTQTHTHTQMYSHASAYISKPLIQIV